MKEAAIASGTVALGILLALIGRLDQTKAHHRGHGASLLALMVTLCGLAVSSLAGALVIPLKHVPASVPASQLSFVLLGLMFLLAPPLAELNRDLKEAWSGRLWVWVSLALLVLLAVAIIVMFFVMTPAWAASSYVGLVIIATYLRVRYGRPPQTTKVAQTR